MVSLERRLIRYVVSVHGMPDARMVGDMLRIAIPVCRDGVYDSDALVYCRPTYDDVRRELGY